MSEIIPFTYEGAQVRTLNVAGEPWFVLADLCKVLELSNPTMVAQRITSESLSTTEVLDARGVSHPTNVVDEAGVYEAIFMSRKPEATMFRRWITTEVLPSIRKRGVYATATATEAMLADPDVMIRALEELKTERAKRVEVEAAREADQPKVLFADSVASSHTSILVGDLAKILKGNGYNIGANRLFAVLREDGFLIRRQGTSWNMPTQRSMELGLFEVKETAVTHADGHVTVSKTPKVTGKGQAYFINRFLSKEAQ